MQQKIKRITWSVGICALFLAVLLMPLVGQAQTDRYWIGGDGLWSSDSNWDPSGVPQTGDRAVLNTSGTVTYDSTATDPTLRELDINALVGNSMVFNHSSGTLTLQPYGGKNDSLFVNATGTGSYASYDLSGDGVLVKTSYEVKIGTDGTGYFNQSGGTFEFSGALYLGDQPTGHGIYTLTNGDIVTGPNGAGLIVLGEWGGATGEFLQSGGTVNIDSLTLARQSNSIGNYELSSTGSLTVNGELIVGGFGTGTFTQKGGTLSSGRLIIGASAGVDGGGFPGTGIGIFSHTEGSNTVNGDLILGDAAGSKGTYYLSDTGELYTENLFVGNYGTGLFDHSSGKVEVANELIVGRYGGSNGTYNLSGTGELYASREIVGDAGSTLSSSGTFNQSGDSIHVIYNDLIIGQDSNSTGIFTLADNAQLTVQGNLYLGDEGGNGTFSQSGNSSLTVDNRLVIGTNSETSGPSGAASFGTFTQAGGTTNVGADLVLGEFAGTTGTYNLSGGELNVAHATIVGKDGKGGFNLGYHDEESGEYVGNGTHITSDLYVGYNTGTDPINKGIYNLYSGTLNVVGGNDLMGFTVIGGKDYGPVGIGKFNQYGGEHNSGGLFLGDSAGSQGTYNLYGGALNVGTWNVIGGSGAVGFFNQYGGIYTASGNLEVGGAGTGTYNLVDGELTTKGTIVGNWGTGTFNQGWNPDTFEVTGGGTHSVNGDLVLGANGGTAGTYNLYNGDLTVNGNTTVYGNTVVGSSGEGTFNQYGGTHTAKGLVLGQVAGSIGKYNLSGNGSVLSVTGDSGIYLGVSGTGSFIQKDTSTVEANNLFIGTAGGSGSYELNGGSLSLAGTTNIGYSGTGTFTQAGGTHTIAGLLALGIEAAGTGTYNMGGGELKAGWIDVGVDGKGTFTQTGGTVTADNTLVIGRNSTAANTYALSGDVDTVKLTTGGTVVGALGAGTFTQAGGSHSTGTLALGYNTGGSGTYNLNGGNLSSTDQRIGMDGTGAFIQNAGTNTVDGTLYIGTASAGTGKYEMLGGTLTAENIRNRTLGTFIAGPGTTTTVNNLFTNYGLVSGAGIIAGNFTNYGTVAPGTSPGTLTINGNYTQAGGILEIELGGKGAGDYDVLSITGDATLAGTLKLLLFGTSYSPTGGDYFDVLFAKAITGGFTIDGSGTGWNWSIEYGDFITGNGLLEARLTATAPVPIPAGIWLLGAGLVGLIGIRRRLRK